MIVFGLAFAGLWMMDRRKTYIALLAFASASFAVGSLVQILWWSHGPDPNAVLSDIFYTLAGFMMVQALLLRAQVPLKAREALAIFGLFLLVQIFFIYIIQDVLVRAHMQNFVYGFILAATAMRLRHLVRGSAPDRVLLGVLVIYATHFFVRSLLMVTQDMPHDHTSYFRTPFWQTLQFSLTFVSVTVAMTALGAAVCDLISDLRDERDRDSLTGLLNRRGFEERVTQILRRRPLPVSLLVCDIDRFKQINDRLGHHVGDLVLCDIAAILTRTARKQDVLGRFGGEEFTVFLPGTDIEEALQCAERLRVAIASYHFAQLPEGEQVTASFGVAQFEPEDCWSSLMNRADMRLYAAKNAGRNCAVATSGPIVMTLDGADAPVKLSV